MISFESDYNNGAHPKVLEALVKTNDAQESGYGFDSYTESAIQKIKKAIGKEDVDVFFLVGGTQTNLTVISTMLRPYQGVIACQSGHVAIHEAGAIEGTGHKVLALPEHDGKINAKELKSFVNDFYGDGNHDHMVFPGMVYISQPTEYGTLYSLAELKAIHSICQSYNLPLFVDGARLGYGLASKENDVSMNNLAELSDVFYIGGTKVGALCGEAVVFKKEATPVHFITMQKNKGAMLAKGRLLSVQFDALFTDDLYLECGRQGMKTAERLVSIFENKGYQFFRHSPTNQQYIVLENSEVDRLSKLVKFSFWEKVDENHTAVRFVTSWATKDSDLDYLESIL